MAYSPRTTQSDVARLAGVSRATVSLAVRNHPTIAPATRQKVLNVARELNYIPDPVLSALAVYRNRRASHPARKTLAWIESTAGGNARRKEAGECLSGARRRCSELGFDLTALEVDESTVTWSRAADIAHARGVHGVVICPGQNDDLRHLATDWRRFSVVMLGGSIDEPVFHSVSPCRSQAVRKCFTQLYSRGYRRIAYWMDPEEDRNLNHLLSASYLAACQMHRGCEPLPPYESAHGLSPEFEVEGWVERHRPEAWIVPDAEVAGALSRLPTARWERSAFACSRLPAPNDSLDGVIEDLALVGATLIDLVIDQIQRGERGFATPAHQISIEGQWCTANLPVECGAGR